MLQDPHFLLGVSVQAVCSLRLRQPPAQDANHWLGHLHSLNTNIIMLSMMSSRRTTGSQSTLLLLSFYVTMQLQHSYSEICVIVMRKVGMEEEC